MWTRRFAVLVSGISLFVTTGSSVYAEDLGDISGLVTTKTNPSWCANAGTGVSQCRVPGAAATPTTNNPVQVTVQVIYRSGNPVMGLTRDNFALATEGTPPGSPRISILSEAECQSCFLEVAGTGVYHLFIAPVERRVWNVPAKYHPQLNVTVPWRLNWGIQRDLLGFEIEPDAKAQ